MGIQVGDGDSGARLFIFELDIVYGVREIFKIP